MTDLRCPLLLIAGVLGIALSGCAGPSAEPSASLDTFTDHLDARLPALMDRYDVPGATLALVRAGEPVWTGAYGWADREQGRPMTTDALFRAESISKPVTAWGVMRLVDQGHVGLDDPVQQHLGDWTLPASEVDAQPITIRHLLSNSAGLALGTIGEEYAPGSDVPPLRNYLTREVERIRPPGSAFAYSNAGFNLLQLLIESVTGRDFAAHMAEDVLRPLGMERAHFAWSDSLRPTVPMGYDLDGTPVPPYVYPAQASGGLWASADAIARFVAAEVARPDSARSVLDAASLRTLHTPQIAIPGLFGFVADAYGLGHFIETLPDSGPAIWHGGQGHGWMTHFHAVPATGDGIVILTNSQRSWPLMAHVLTDWARWSGIGSVKMGRITTATTALHVLIGFLGLMALAQAVRLGRGLLRGTRRWAPLASTNWRRRSLQMALSLGVLTALAWMAAQPYLMVSSIFPRAAGWAGIALFGLACLGFLSALFPPMNSKA